MGRGAWQTTAYGVIKSQTQLSDQHFTSVDKKPVPEDTMTITFRHPACISLSWNSNWKWSSLGQDQGVTATPAELT